MGPLWRLLFLTGIAAATAPFAARALPQGFMAAGPPADDASNPYSVIVERNIFHLNPLPPPPEPEKPKVELPVVKITGFLSVGTRNKVLFSATSKEKKEPAYYSLVEGERSGDGKLELVKIHPAKDAVDVINDGTLVTLTLKDDAAKPSETASATPAGEAPPSPGGPPSPVGRFAGKPLFPGRSLPGAPGPGANGFAFPMRPRRNLQ